MRSGRLWLLAAVAFADAAAPLSVLDAALDPESKPEELDARYASCPKVFVPGRAGGFLNPGGRHGCCFAGRALSLAEVLLELHDCPRFHHTPGIPCYAGALHDLAIHMDGCCRSRAPAPAGGGRPQRVRLVAPTPEATERCYAGAHTARTMLLKAVPWFGLCWHSYAS